MIPTIHGFSPPGEVQLCLMGGGVKGPGKAPAPSKVKKEAVGGSSCSQKPREPREPGRPEKPAESDCGAASSGLGAGAENIKRKSRLEVEETLQAEMELRPFYFQGGEREPNLCLGAELASYDEVKVGNIYL